MIIKYEIIRYRGDEAESENGEKDVVSSWYTAQSYFDEYLREEFLSSDVDMIHLHWRGKLYEFRKKR